MDHLLIACLLNLIRVRLGAVQAGPDAQQEFATALQNVNEAHRAIEKYAERIGKVNL